MKKWLRRIRGAVGMGLTWAVGWAVAGILIGVASILQPWLPWNRFFEVFDAPLPALAVPGFFGGALFSVVLGIAGRRSRFAELSLARFAAWGVVGGVLLTLLPAALVAVGLASVNPDKSLWRSLAAVSGPLILLSAVSASVTLMVARKTEHGELPETSADVAESGLTEAEARELLGGGDRPLHSDVPESHRERVRRDPARGPGNA